MDKAQKRVTVRMTRAARIRKTITGSAERPRLCVRRSLNHIYAQLVDDVNGTTVAQVSSTAKDVQQVIASVKDCAKKDASRVVGELIATKAIEKGVKKVVFDRKGYAFHGRIKALADGARSKGLEF